MSTRNSACPVETIIGMVSGKWRFMILKTLIHGKPLRFTQIQKQLCGISPKVLSQHLVHLEQDGLIHRHIYEEIPPHVDYCLTEAGSGILLALMKLLKYASNLPKVEVQECLHCKVAQ